MYLYLGEEKTQVWAISKTSVDRTVQLQIDDGDVRAVQHERGALREADGASGAGEAISKLTQRHREHGAPAHARAVQDGDAVVGRLLRGLNLPMIRQQDTSQ
eukprot:1175424-Prorocentrum_minimum.AAC.8